MYKSNHLSTISSPPVHNFPLYRMAYEKDPDALVEAARPEQEKLMAKLSDARARLPKVKMSMDLQVRSETR